MVFKNFYLQTGLRLLLLIITAIVLTWLVVSGQKLIFILNLLALLVLQLIWLLWYLNKWNRELYDFFRGLKESNYEIPRHLGWKWLRPMELPLKELKDFLRKQQVQKEIENEYFRVMSEQVATGILVFDQEWEVRFSNKAVLNLLNLEVIRNIHTIERSQAEIVSLLKEMTPGAATEYVLKADQNPKILMIHSSEFVTEDKRYKVFVFDNIQQLINRKEVESWQKLIRVLNHEIMNSIGPIKSTTELLIEKWEVTMSDPEEQKKLAAKTIKGLAVIGDRSTSLAEFVNAYRSLTKNPIPELTLVKLDELLTEIIQLFEEELASNEIELNLNINDKADIHADKAFVQQILVNLIKNAIESFLDSDREQRIIDINACQSNQRVLVVIKDNGKGMSSEILENALIPFFTTRETGSGIGLSLARQLMFSMEGSLEIRSREGKGTEVRLLF